MTRMVLSRSVLFMVINWPSCGVLYSALEIFLGLRENWVVRVTEGKT